MGELDLEIFGECVKSASHSICCMAACVHRHIDAISFDMPSNGFYANKLIAASSPRKIYVFYGARRV